MDLRKAYIILSTEMIKHGLAYEHGTMKKKWTFGFDNAKKRFGVCKKNRKQITISKYLTFLNSEEEFRDTVLHEIAHALAIERGVHDGHGPQWRSIAREIGCVPRRCHNAEVVPGRFVYNCGGCGKEARFHRRPKRTRACRDCCNKHNGGRYDTRFEFKPHFAVRT